MLVFKDESRGDLICTECGRVVTERLISEAPEWRNFEGDDDHSRVGIVYHSDLVENLTTTMGVQKYEHDDQEFLEKGLREIRNALYNLRQGSVDERTEMLATHYFHSAYQYMLLQKHGLAPTFKTSPAGRRQGNSSKATKKASEETSREKLARRKTFAVAAIHKALRDQGYDRRWSLDTISQLFEGMEVSKEMLKRASLDLKHAWYHNYPEAARKEQLQFESASLASPLPTPGVVVREPLIITVKPRAVVGVNMMDPSNFEITESWDNFISEFLIIRNE